MGIRFYDSKIYFRFYFQCFLLVLMIVAEVSYFVSKISSNNLVDLCELAPCIFIGALSFLKILFLVMKKEMIFELTDCLQSLYVDAVSNLRQKMLIGNEVVNLNKLLRYYFILNAVLIWVYNLAAPVFMIYHYAVKGEVVFSLPYAILVPFPTDMWSTWFIVYVFSISCGKLYFTLKLFSYSGWKWWFFGIESLCYEYKAHHIICQNRPLCVMLNASHFYERVKRKLFLCSVFRLYLRVVFYNCWRVILYFHISNLQ